MRWGRLIVSPRIKPLGARFGVPRGCFLPLRLRRKALAGPPGVGVSLVPRDVHHRCRGVEGFIEAEPLSPPAMRLGLVPVLRRADALLFDVLPSARVPEFLSLVTTVLDELYEGCVGDGGRVDEEVGEVHDVCVPLVVQSTDSVIGAHDELAARYGDHLLLYCSPGWEFNA